MARRLTPAGWIDHLPLYEESLAYFRTAETLMAHTAVFLVGCRRSQKILAAFTTLPVSWEQPNESPPLDISRVKSGDALTHQEAGRLWDWLWEGVAVDFDLLCERTDLERAEVEQKFEVLRASRLVYPDGSAAGMATGVLRAAVGKAIRPGVSKGK